MHENGFADEHVELQLAHQKRNKVAAAYNHAKYLKQRKEMMQWWSDYLDAQLAKGRQNTELRLDHFVVPYLRVITRNRQAALSSRSRRAYTLYGPLFDFGLDPSNGARSQPHRVQETFSPESGRRY